MGTDRGGASGGSSTVTFDVRGKDFNVALDTLDKYPDSYLAWLVRNAPDQVRAGRPIAINRKPESFKNLLENYRRTSRRSDVSSLRDAFHRASLRSTRDRSPAPVPDDDQPPSTSSRAPGSHRSHNQHQHQQHPPPPPRPPSSLYASAAEDSISSALAASRRGQPPGNAGEAAGLPTADRPRRTGSTGTLGGAGGQRGTEEVVDEAVRDIAATLKKCAHKVQMYDKALFVLIWGRKSEGGRSLRPQLSKLYDSMTGKAHDVRRSSDGGDSFEQQGGWGEFDSVYSATCLSARVQSMVVDRLRRAGYGASFAEVCLDRAGHVNWRGSRRGSQPALESSTVRCLVANLK
ncbi:unnamed protein product [Ostreobium quekettii]|uniref:Potassium channel tetramerisation-type BTB domain-containing protein n=1 Tax=Ostreobium quekettii TaxID=121088 RepID=A0A8S1ITW0_9CHLO|nr:unnamed protein product [Ostreobium quekettii]|eukprot:evm.model.scf_1291.3 EVM.evm.TU.scf_1291.3   scf_1291:25382-30156(+)